MSSLKMTFSLASLVLILGLIAMPVMAQDDLAGYAYCYDNRSSSSSRGRSRHVLLLLVVRMLNIGVVD